MSKKWKTLKPKFEQAHLSISVEGEGAELQLDIDRKQIMVNLLVNSICYTEGGQVQVHTEQSATSWTVYIDDSPYGLNDEQLARLGERFYRVDDSRTRAHRWYRFRVFYRLNWSKALGGELSFDHSPLGGLRCKLTLKNETQRKYV